MGETRGRTCIASADWQRVIQPLARLLSRKVKRRTPVRRSRPDLPHLVSGYAPPSAAEDPEIELVARTIVRKDPHGQVFADVLRETFDQLYDGQRTGRWSPEQLHKTEKTHMGTLVEINVHRAFGFDDGEKMDYNIAGVEVDCKFAGKLGGWMLPREAYLHDHICLVIWASEELNRWEAGLVRAMPRSPHLDASELDDLLGATNQDLKRPLTAAGESRVRWLYDAPSLPENLLYHLDAETREQIFAARGRGRESGQAKVNMLFRLVQRRIVNRASLLTVARQKDSPKRARDARVPKNLGQEGILVLGHQEDDPIVAAHLGLPVPSKGDFVSARVVPAERDWRGQAAEIGGELWRLAEAPDPVIPAPQMKRAGRRSDDD